MLVVDESWGRLDIDQVNIDQVNDVIMAPAPSLDVTEVPSLAVGQPAEESIEGFSLVA